jgi:peptidoglycan/LPS O-acetylase OafA/YrhL
MRFDVLDSFRGMAALVVLMVHALANLGLGAHLPHATLAVDFFFCLSGFVICHAYQGRLTDGLGFGAFFKARVLRLYPTIAIGLVLGLLVLAFRVLIEYRPDWVRPGLATFLMNAFLLPSPWLTMGYDAAWPLNGTHWSLTSEILINLLWAAGIWRLRPAVSRALTLLLLALLLAVVAQHGTLDVGWRLHELPLGLLRASASFLLGVEVYRLRAQRLNSQVATANGLKFGLTALLLLAFLLAPTGWVSEAVYATIFLCLVCPLVLLVGASTLVSDRWSGWCRALGDLSFPLYAIHHPILRLAQVLSIACGTSGYASLAMQVMACLVSIWFAWFTLRRLDPWLRAWLLRTGSALARHARRA